MRRSTRTHIRRGLAAATITALVTTGATTAVVATAVSSAQAYDRVQAQTDTPPERGSIHEEAARQAASSYREKAQEQRATEERIRSEVVDIALDQIGDNYVAGGEGPNAFDCSGLVVYAYKSVGIKLTHYSRAQYR
ncbi:MAG: NlpC/P60 family protein, partial [Candidatus Nanopelagicales bacterium]